MKKPILFLLGLLFLSLNVLATNVSGYIGSNTTWTKANSPYVITGDIDVDTGATLTIEPGVTIIADGNHTLYIDGKISAIGTASDNITFTCKQVPKDVYSATWQGIEVRHTSFSDTFYFEYCHFQYAANALFVRGNPVKINNCKFDHNGTAFKNFDFPESYALIEKCRFQYNSYGLFIAGRHVLVSNNVISDADYGFYGKGDVIYNIVYNCAYGIAGGYKVHHNTVFNCNEGLSTGGDTVSYNQLWHNKIGLRYSGNVVVIHNGIKYNETGIICSGLLVGNPIRNNCIEGSSAYAFFNGNDFVDISNNYWGTTDSLTIDSKVFDFFDNFTSGKTKFMPVLANEDQGCADSLQLPDTTNTNHTNDTALSINEVSRVNDIDLYPNPATNTVVIKTGNNDAIKMVCLYTITGSIAQQIAANTNRLTLNITSIPNGMYLVKVFTADGKVQVTKLLKE